MTATPESFRSLVLHEREGGGVDARLQQSSLSDLPEGEVLVRVSHSTLNYKDGMILKGLGRLVRRYPHVPGVDFAGTVESSSSPDWKAGDRVILTGWRVGESRWGGYAQYARVKAEWLVALPDGLSPARAMAIGTAGFTAMLAVQALEAHGLTPDKGEVLVTGAAGGLGSVAVAILAKLGYRVVASTGRAETHDYLRALGAADFLDRAVLSAAPSKPLDSERWAGAVDSVGGTTLAHLLTQLRHRGSVAACGLAGGNDLPTSVIPFLLRGVNLLGIDSVLAPPDERRSAWARLAADLPADRLDAMTETIGLGELPDWAGRILDGKTRGRVVVDVDR